MTLNKYLKQVANLFDVEKRKCEKEKQCLRHVLKKLKKREEMLENRLDKHKHDKSRKKLKDELKVISAQRRKGLKMLKDLEKK